MSSVVEVSSNFVMTHGRRNLMRERPPIVCSIDFTSHILNTGKTQRLLNVSTDVSRLPRDQEAGARMIN